MYELAYCDDAVSLIGHIVYTLGPLLFRRHHRHCLSIFTFICWTNCSLPLPTILNLRHNLIGIVCLLSQRHCLVALEVPTMFCFCICWIWKSGRYLLGASCIVHYWCIPFHMSGAQLGVCSYIGGSRTILQQGGD